MPAALISAPAPSGDFGNLLSDVSGFLDLLPLQNDACLDIDTQASYQGLDHDGNWDFDFAAPLGDGFFDQVLMPDMTANLDTQQLGMGDGFIPQDQSLLTVNSELPSTTSTPLPPNKSSSSSSIPGTSTFSLHPSPSSSSSSHKRKASPEEQDSAATLKRQRNTLAARKYRQKRLDRITELENALAAMTGERDDMRLQLARREAEVDALRDMLGKKRD
ncbi:hypothetical protein F66182_7699 [Fusarium sp. NRRL 66182]|nr:hypothetical protein F66182_7699 [Fusarium sp. NRRL 66182]